MFNGTFSTHRLYHAMSVSNVSLLKAGNKQITQTHTNAYTLFNILPIIFKKSISEMALNGLIRAEVPLIRHYSLNLVFVEITSSTLCLDSL